MAAELVVEIVNKRGLHARAAAKFVKIVTSYAAQVQVVKLGTGGEENSPVVGGSSILGLMMLGADKGSKLFITAVDDQAQEALAALKELIQNRFGEDE